MKKLSVLPGLCSGSTMASLTLHGGLIALALLLGGQASLPQEKVYRVSLAQMAASVRPAAAPGLPDGHAAVQARAALPQEAAKPQEVQQPQPQPVNNLAQASEKMISPVKKKTSTSKPAQQVTQQAKQKVMQPNPLQTATVAQLQNHAEANPSPGVEAQARGLADGKGSAGMEKTARNQAAQPAQACCTNCWEP